MNSSSNLISPKIIRHFVMNCNPPEYIEFCKRSERGLAETEGATYYGPSLGGTTTTSTAEIPQRGRDWALSGRMRTIAEPPAPSQPRVRVRLGCLMMKMMDLVDDHAAGRLPGPPSRDFGMEPKTTSEVKRERERATERARLGALPFREGEDRRGRSPRRYEPSDPRDPIRKFHSRGPGPARGGSPYIP